MDKHLNSSTGMVNTLSAIPGISDPLGMYSVEEPLDVLILERLLTWATPTVEDSYPQFEAGPII